MSKNNIIFSISLPISVRKMWIRLANKSHKNLSEYIKGLIIKDDEKEKDK